MAGFTQHLLTTPQDLAAAMARLPAEGAVAFPLVDEAGCTQMLAATETLPFRACRPVVGSPGNEVTQDFTISMTFEERTVLDDYQEAFEQQLNAAFEIMEPQPYPTPFAFNDKAVLRYAKGSDGISPHRDLLCFEALVAILTLKGSAGFYICDDREKTNSHRLAAEAGVMILMRGTNFAGIKERPFHYVEGVSEDRVGFGLRFNAKEAAAAERGKAQYA